MSEVNFTSMSREELREYVKTHPLDTTAFHIYMDKLPVYPNPKLNET